MNIFREIASTQSVKVIVFGVLLGAVESLIEHSGAMTHGPMIMNNAERLQAQITDILVHLKRDSFHLLRISWHDTELFKYYSYFNKFTSTNYKDCIIVYSKCCKINIYHIYVSFTIVHLYLIIFPVTVGIEYVRELKRLKKDEAHFGATVALLICFDQDSEGNDHWKFQKESFIMQSPCLRKLNISAYFANLMFIFISNDWYVVLFNVLYSLTS